MSLRCLECGNTDNFTAEAQATIDVVIDGDGNVVSSRPFQQMFKDIDVQKPWKCNSCGSVGKIQDEGKEKRTGGKLDVCSAREVPED